MLHRRSAPPADPHLARAAGVWYLALILTGVAGYLVIRPQLYDTEDPAMTLQQLIANDTLARVGIALELAIVVTQAAVALWLFRLFRQVNAVADGAVFAFGLTNAVVILASAATLATAHTVAGQQELAPAGDAAATVQLAYTVSAHLWGVGSVFFGLWLIPLGLLVLHSGWMPRTLGWFLLIGGVGYTLSAFASPLLPGLEVAGEVLTLPAVIGEFWLVGYMLTRGVRRVAEPAAAP
ncbi:DUF4386 domain-containing protein [Nesterenkonia sphaerica]|uniref:DUF4386 domain-containing protein n=1 Tax=Nesterenkonia sphaerica TaxID=1804988 RepID=A0A5R9A6D1_9MICC|nr:DUF4386 domain-containing protein [Nesterenkonia sphaerica]TLP74233.1 DUF4386 domain-containing protein [Nesterenkonia sphaerica]